MPKERFEVVTAGFLSCSVFPTFFLLTEGGLGAEIFSLCLAISCVLCNLLRESFTSPEECWDFLAISALDVTFYFIWHCHSFCAGTWRDARLLFKWCWPGFLSKCWFFGFGVWQCIWFINRTRRGRLFDNVGRVSSFWFDGTKGWFIKLDNRRPTEGFSVW